MSVRHLMRTDLERISPYQAPLDPASLGRDVVLLHANENPYGPSPRVAPAMAAVNAHRYPDAEAAELRTLLAAYAGVAPDQIVCGVGGDEIVDLLLRLMLDPDDEVIDLTPTFGMYAIATVVNRGRVVPVPRTATFAVDVEAVLQALTPRTKVIVLCNPNNPTGNLTPRHAILRILETGRVVLLDEAYAEFAGVSHVDLLERYPNLAILRTLSKWAALAGMRLGYLLAGPEVVAEINRLRQPYNLSSAAQAAAVASLCDRDYLLGNVQRILAERERLRARISSLGDGTVYPSHTNFLYWIPRRFTPGALYAALLEGGVLVRRYRGPDALRISVGTPHESDRLVEVLEGVYENSAG